MLLLLYIDIHKIARVEESPLLGVEYEALE